MIKPVNPLGIIALCLLFVSSGAMAADTVSLEILIDKTLRLDPELQALRGHVEVAEAERRAAAPLNNPQIRLGYAEASDTEDLGVIVDPLALPSDDLNDRTEQYSAQLRLYPRNPFVIYAEKKRAGYQVDIVELELAAAAHVREQEVTRQYLDTVQAFHEYERLKAEHEFQKEEAIIRQALHDAGRLSPEEYSDGKIQGIQIAMDVLDAEQQYLTLKQKLVHGAGLAADAEISLLIPDRLARSYTPDIKQLQALMKQHNPELFRMDAERMRARSEISVLNAGRVPWINLVAASYQREERFDVKYRDEYSIVAGIELPVFSWLSGRDKKPARLRMHQITQFYSDTESRLEAELALAGAALKSSEDRRVEIAEQAALIDEDIAAGLVELEGSDDLLQRKQAIRYQRLRLELEAKTQRVNHEHALRVLDVERLLGTRL